jgi:hypothetical protein
MESFWAALKTEFIFHPLLAIRQPAVRGIAEYIEVLANRQRIQEQLD